LVWGQIPELWAKLETLEVMQFAGFTMSMMADLLPFLPNLKKVILPQRIAFNCALFEDMKRELSNRHRPAEISLAPFSEFSECSFLDG